jgi:hypothetical protein
MIAEMRTSGLSFFLILAAQNAAKTPRFLMAVSSFD